MPRIRDNGVVLRKLEYSETSQVVVLFARNHGKIRAIAKGIRRNTKTCFSPGIDLLDVGQATLSARSDRSEQLALLTEFKLTAAHSGIRESLPRLYGASYVAEITAALTEDWDPHPRAFDQMMSCLSALSCCHDPLEYVARYQLELLIEVGSLPRFDRCVKCRRAEDLSHFSSFDGGMVCERCAATQGEKRPVTAETLASLQTNQWKPPVTGIFRLFDYHISHQVGHELRLRAKLV